MTHVPGPFALSVVYLTTDALPSIELRDPRTFVPGFALFRVLEAMTKEYSAAIAAGHVPDETWLVRW